MFAIYRLIVLYITFFQEFVEANIKEWEIPVFLVDIECTSDTEDMIQFVKIMDNLCLHTEILMSDREVRFHLVLVKRLDNFKEEIWKVEYHLIGLLNF